MADTMVKPRAVGGSISQAHRDVTDDRYRDLRKPRKVKFYCNGDRYFKGKKIFVTPHRYLTFNDLLNDLTGKLPSTVQLPYGVRQIFTPVGGRKIRDIDELQDGQHYVCGGFETFKTIPYGNKSLEPWTSGKTHGAHEGKDGFAGGLGGATYGQQAGYGQRGYYNAFQPGRSLRNYPRKGINTYGNRAGYGSMWQQAQPQNEASLKPKVVTVIRNGAKPRSNVKILLNRRSVQSYEQLVKDISEAFGPKWKNNKVRKLFSIRGREIQGVSDFFRDDDVFIGIGNESLTTSDVQEILEELYPESPYAKNLMKEWEKTKKKQQQSYHARLKPEDGKEAEKSKIDSGLGSDESARDEAESEATFKSKEKEKKKKKQRGGAQPEEAVAQANEPASDSTNHRMERERVRYSEIERERARKRLAKRMETDRKILEEERRKKGLVPLKPIQDPFKKLQDDREKEQKEAKEREREEAARKEAEEHQREMAKAEARARARQRKAQQQQQEAEEKENAKVIVVVKGDQKDSAKAARRKQRHEDDSRSPQRSPVRKVGGDKAVKERKDKENEEKKEEKIDKEKEVSKVKEEKPKAPKEEKPKPPKDDADTKSVKDSVSELKTEAEPPKPKPPLKEKTPEKIEKPVSAAPPKTPKTAPPKTPKSAPKTPKPQQPAEKSTTEPNKDKEKTEKAAAKHRQKSKIVRKTKLERQISSVDTVLEKYEPGKTLGDGNFAIVKTCKLKNTSHEFAMKIVDKSKLRGKEHMIENEIAIMKACNHSSIVKLMEEFETKAEIYLIMELVKGGDLFDAITQSVKFDERTASGMCTDVVNALFYLHSRDIVHRDLKPENLLVLRNKDGSISLKLADFGLAMEVHQPIYTVCGTPTYVAPEILSEIGYGLEVDMWAVGVITYILLCGFPPFRSPDRNQTELFEFIKAGEYDFLSPYWDNISRAAKDLISRLLIVDRRKRYTAVDVLVHPWVITFAGSKHPPAPMDEHRRSLRAQLDSQAKSNKAEYLALTGKADKAT